MELETFTELRDRLLSELKSAPCRLTKAETTRLKDARTEAELWACILEHLLTFSVNRIDPGPIPSSVKTTGDLHLLWYKHPISPSVTATGDLHLMGYDHPLPSSITEVGFVFAWRYDHQLPLSITKIAGVSLLCHPHKLPESITEIKGLRIEGDNYSLPGWTAGLMGNKFPLPEGEALKTARLKFGTR